MNAIPAHFQSMSIRPRHVVDVAATPICTTPGSFGERARSRSARASSCFSIPKACNIRQDYWLYAVYNCATPNPRLARVQDPFGNLLAKAKGSVLVSHAQVAEAEVENHG